MRVLLTRPRDDSVELAQQLAGMGYEAVISPVIDIAPLEVAEFPEYCVAAIASSRHAIENTAPQHRKMLRSKALYLVGKRTELAARSQGFVEICCAAKDAASLAAFILTNPPEGPLIYLAARHRKRELEDRLRASGLQVVTVETYEARACAALNAEAADALRTGALDAALHFSRRSAALFAALAEKAGLAQQAGGLRHICISQAAASGLLTLDARHIAIAREPDMPSMLAALEALQ